MRKSFNFSKNLLHEEHSVDHRFVGVTVLISRAHNYHVIPQLEITIYCRISPVERGLRNGKSHVNKAVVIPRLSSESITLT